MKAHYRRGRTVQVGGLTIRRPLFLEMALGGLVRGAPGPIVGVIGAQLFWRCCHLTLCLSRSLAGPSVDAALTADKSVAAVHMPGAIRRSAAVCLAVIGMLALA